MVKPNNDENFWGLMVEACPVPEAATNRDSVFIADEVEHEPAPAPKSENVPQADINDLLARIAELEKKLNTTATEDQTNGIN